MIGGPISSRVADVSLALAACRTASRLHDVSLPRALRRAMRLKFGQGFAPEEALVLGLLDPALPESELDRFASKRRVGLYLKPLNPREMTPATEEKAVFYRLCELAGLPIPELHAVHYRRATGWSTRGDVLADRDAWIRYLADGPGDEFVVKPTRGYWGLAVQLLRREGDGFVDAIEGTALTAGDVFDRMEAPGPFEGNVLQARVHNHPDLDVFGDGALKTIRVVTVVTRDGTVRPLSASLKLPGAGVCVDNFRGGRSGGSIVTIDIATGRLVESTVPHPRGAGMIRSVEHQASGIRVDEVAIPRWDEVLDLARRASIEFLPTRSIGWDLAVTPDGPVVIEANRSWDAPNNTRSMHRLLAELGDV